MSGDGLMMMLVLFLGMASSGVAARVTLLSHRGGWFLEDQKRKSNGMVLFDLIRAVSGWAAFVISFLLFDWWLPLVALGVGYWAIAPLIVKKSSFEFFYETQLMTSLTTLFCSLLILSVFLGTL